AELCLWVLDASAAPVWPDFPLDAVRYVISKMDLAAVWDLGQVAAVRVSAHSGAGIADLCQVLAQALVPAPPAAGTAVPFTPHFCTRVEEAWRCYAAGQPAQSRHVLESLGDSSVSGTFLP